MVIKMGEQMKAKDMLNLVFFPKGTVLMFAGTDYDSLDKNVWRLCDGQNGRPDLRDRFVRGGTSSGAVGNGKKTLSETEMPSHTHLQNPHRHAIQGRVTDDGGSAAHGMEVCWYTAFDTECSEEAIRETTATNKHTGGGAAFDIIPAYYTLVYIIKVTDAGQ